MQNNKSGSGKILFNCVEFSFGKNFIEIKHMIRNIFVHKSVLKIRICCASLISVQTIGNCGKPNKM